MALTEQETRLLSELVELREAYNDAGAFSTQDSIQMLQAALGLITPNAE